MHISGISSPQVTDIPSNINIKGDPLPARYEGSLSSEPKEIKPPEHNAGAWAHLEQQSGATVTDALDTGNNIDKAEPCKTTACKDASKDYAKEAIDGIVERIDKLVATTAKAFLSDVSKMGQ